MSAVAASSESGSIRLGDIHLDKRVFVRESRDMHAVQRLVNVLRRERVLDPMLVEESSRILIGGHTRYEAYRIFYGDVWQSVEVPAQFVSLPPFDRDPSVWLKLAVSDNAVHRGYPLNGRDANMVAKRLIAELKLDPYSPEVTEIVTMLEFTSEKWKEFAEGILSGLRAASPAPPASSHRGGVGVAEKEPEDTSAFPEGTRPRPRNGVNPQAPGGYHKFDVQVTNKLLQVRGENFKEALSKVGDGCLLEDKTLGLLRSIYTKLGEVLTRYSN